MSSRRSRIVLGIVGAVAVFGVLAILRSSNLRSTEPEDLVPAGGEEANPARDLGDIEGLVLDGFDSSERIALASFKGKPLVVNYWASWCLFCIEEMPDFQKVYEDVRKDVEFLGVNIQDDESHAKQLLEVTKVRYPLASDPDGRVYRTLKGFSMPTTWFVDERGEIVERFSGPLDAEQLRDRIRRNFDV